MDLSKLVDLFGPTPSIYTFMVFLPRNVKIYLLFTPRSKPSAISLLSESATFESSEYDRINFGEGDLFLRCGDGDLPFARGLGDGVLLTGGGLDVGDRLLP